MKNLALLLASMVLVLTLSGFSSKAATSIEGDWIGEFTEIDHSVPFKARFWQKDGGLMGTITLASDGSRELPLSWVMAESTSIHFELVERSRILVFDGILRNGLISGDLRYSNLRGTFQLAQEKLVSM